MSLILELRKLEGKGHEELEVRLLFLDLNTEIVPNLTKATLQGIIRGKVDLDSIIYSDGWRSYDKHFKVHHGANESVRGNSHIKGIESFWSYAKIRLVKFHGMDKRTFNLHLEECEFRFNNRGEDLYKLST